MKISIIYRNVTQSIEILLKYYTTNSNLELQQRSVEYLYLLRLNDAKLLSDLFQNLSVDIYSANQEIELGNIESSSSSEDILSEIIGKKEKSNFKHKTRKQKEKGKETEITCQNR